MRILFALLVGVLFQEASIEAWISKLSDESLQVREIATASLMSADANADILLKRALSSAEGEARSRLQRILEIRTRKRTLAAVLPKPPLIKIRMNNQLLTDFASQFAKETSWPIVVSAEHKGPIDITLSAVTPFEALEALCKEAGVSYELEASRDFLSGELQRELRNGRVFSQEELPVGVRITSLTYKPRPRYYSGHYLVKLQQLDIFKSTDFDNQGSGGTLDVQLLWPPSLKPARVNTFSLTSVTDDKGKELYDPKVRDSNVQDEQLLSEGKILTAHIRYPTSAAKKLRSVKGSVIVEYKLGIETVAFENPKDKVGSKLVYAGLDITLSGFEEKDGKVRATLLVQGQRNDEVNAKNGGFGWRAGKRGLDGRYAQLILENGGTPQRTDRSLSPKDTYVELELRAESGKSEVKSISIEMDTLYYMDSFEFEFRDISLPE